MPRVKILGQAITASHGTLETGDIVNVSDEFAAHLVNDCRVAEYLDSKPGTAAIESADEDPVEEVGEDSQDPADSDADGDDAAADQAAE